MKMTGSKLEAFVTEHPFIFYFATTLAFTCCTMLHLPQTHTVPTTGQIDQNSITNLQSFFFIEQIFITVLLAAAGVFIGGCYSKRQIETKTIELLLEENTKEFLVTKRLEFSKALTKLTLLKTTPIAEIENNDQTLSAITFILERYETIATGIEYKDYSEEIFNERMGKRLIQEWKKLLPLICQIRLDTDNPDLYIKVQHLVERLTYLNKKNKKY